MSSTNSSVAQSIPSTIAVPTPPTDRTFEARSLPGAVYDVLGEDIVNRPREWLGSGDVSILADYHLVDHPASRPGGWSKTTAHWNDRAEEEVRTSLFGELCGEVWGKKVSARGTWVPGWKDDGSRKVIDDSTSVKNRLVVRGPTRPTSVVESGFDNQVCEFRAFEDAVVQHRGSLSNSLVSLAPDGSTDLINVGMEQIYRDTKARTRYAHKEGTSPPKQKQKVSIATMKSLKSENEEMGPSAESDLATGTGNGASSAPSGGPASAATGLPTTWDPDMPVTGDTPATLGATYPVTCLPDHRGPDFNHRRSVVNQPEVWSIEGNLVHPRDLPFHLKAGVLLLMEGKFCVWHTPTGDSLVQFVTDAVKIIADSDEDPELPSTDIAATPPRAPGKSPAKRTAAFTEFGRAASGSSPSKRNKTDAVVDDDVVDMDQDDVMRDEEKQEPKRVTTAKASKKDKGKAVARS